MDLTTVQIVWTVATFGVFILIVLWAYGGRAQRGFDEAQRLPFDDETGGPGSRDPGGSGR